MSATTSYHLPANVCEDGTKCPNGGVCVKSQENLGAWHCDCDYVEENRKYTGMACEHSSPVNCTNMFPVDDAAGGRRDVICFNEGTCEVAGLDGELGCKCRMGYSGDVSRTEESKC